MAKTKDKGLFIRIPEKTHEALKEKAASEKRTLGKQAAVLLEEALDANRREGKN